MKTTSGLLLAAALLAPGGCAKAQKTPPSLTLNLGDNVKLELVPIPAGRFLMGSSEKEIEPESDEVRHEVTISRPFHMGRCEITVAQFRRFVKATGYRTEAERLGRGWTYQGTEWVEAPGACWSNPGFAQGDDHPACLITWNDATAFCEWAARTTSRRLRLPTESEWEYAARAGGRSAYPWGDDPDAGAGWANLADGTGRQKFTEWITFGFSDGYIYSSPVGRFRANAFGLQDVTGNVWEWCADLYGPYPAGPATDPRGATTGEDRVLRGGAWFSIPTLARLANRLECNPDACGAGLGFRVAMDAEQ